MKIYLTITAAFICVALIHGLGPKIGESCTTNEDCQYANRHAYCSFSYNNCESGYCSCANRYYIYSPTFDDAPSCRLAADIGDECSAHPDCEAVTVNSFCDLSVCTCEVGEQTTVVDGQKYCYKSLATDPCDDDDDCLAFHINDLTGGCFGGFCGCQNGYQLNGAVCESVAFGDNCEFDPSDDMSCESNTECLSDGGGSKSCQCPTSTTWDTDRFLCIHDEANDAVAHNQPCSTNYLEADAEICSLGLVCGFCQADNPDLRCLEEPNVVLGDTCEVSAECGAPYSECDHQFTTCDVGQCSCSEGYYNLANTCETGVKVTQACIYDEDCLHTTINSYCHEEGKCACSEADEEVTEIDGVMVCFRSATAEECIEDGECLTFQLNQNGGKCNMLGDEGTCGCVETLQLVGDLCLPISYGSVCNSSNGDMSCVGNTVCLETQEGHKECLCPNETSIYQEVHGNCISEQANYNVGLGETCNNNYLSTNGLICDQDTVDLVCDQCADSNDRVCLERIVAPDDGDDGGSGGSHLIYSLVTLMVATLLALQ